MKRLSRFSFLWTVTALVLAVSLVLPWTVLADTVEPDNDLVTTGNQTLVNLGNVSPGATLYPQVSFTLECGGNKHVDNGQTVTVAYTTAGSTVPPGGSMSATPATIGAISAAWPDDNDGCGTPPPSPLDDNGNSIVTITAPTTPGTYTYVAKYGNITLSPAGGNDPSSVTGNVQVTFQLTVVSDTTPPVISYVLTPASPDGGNGWYKSNVTLVWSVTDPESAVTKTGCVDQNITADQAATTYSCSATSAGGSTGPVEVTIKRDATAPSVTVTPARGPDFGGWYNAPVVFDTAGTDATSGVSDANCTANQNYTGPDGTGLTVSGSCTDNAGNVGSGTSAAFNFDDTDPSVTWSNGPADGASYYFGFVPAAPTCTASDSLSGPNGCTVTGHGTTVGSHTMTATAYDVAGNLKVETRTYTVLAWTLKGFYQPVDMNGVYNTVKGGSTVPLKFEVFAGATELTSTSVVKSFVQAKIACDGTVPNDDIEFTTTGATSLRYDTTAGQFIQNWQTPKLPGQCYRVTMTTQDDSSLVAFFKLK